LILFIRLRLWFILSSFGGFKNFLKAFPEGPEENPCDEQDNSGQPDDGYDNQRYHNSGSRNDDPVPVGVAGYISPPLETEIALDEFTDRNPGASFLELGWVVVSLVPYFYGDVPITSQHILGEEYMRDFGVGNQGDISRIFLGLDVDWDDIWREEHQTIVSTADFTVGT